MWIVYFDGKPRFWLNSGQSYTVGRKGEIEIKGEESISREHVKVEVGLLTGNSLPADAAVAPTGRPSLTPSRRSQGSEATTPGTATKGTAGVALTAVDSDDTPYCSITITDLSRTGTSSRIPAIESVPVRMENGAAVTLPRNTNVFELQLGIKSIMVTFQWSPQTAVVDNVDPETAFKLETAMRYACVAPVPYMKLASLLITSHLRPTAALLTALCACKPIVGPQWVEAVKSRLSVKTPLPEPAEAVELPRDAEDAAWPSNTDVSRESFAPLSARLGLFQGLTLVFLSTQDRDLLGVAVQTAHGNVALTEVPKDISTAQPFAARHAGQVLVLGHDPDGRIAASIKAITGPLKSARIRVVSRSDIIRSIVAAALPEKLCAAGAKGVLTSMRSAQVLSSADPADAASSKEEPSGRRTSRMDPFAADDEGGDEDGLAPSRTRLEDGWRRSRSSAALLAAESSLGGFNDGVDSVAVLRPDEEAAAPQPSAADAAVESWNGQLRFPDYPCFSHVNRQQHVESDGNHHVPRQKVFQKQPVKALPIGASFVEMAVVAPSGPAVTSRIAAVDAMDVIPDGDGPTFGGGGRGVARAVEGMGAADPFNQFDVAAQNREARRKPAAKRATKKSTAGSTGRGARAAAAAPPVINVIDDTDIVPSASPAAATPASRGGGMDIFDVDGLY